MTAFDKAWDIAKGRMTPEEAVEACKGGGCVWLKDYAEENYGDEDNPHYDYPVEDPEDIMRMIEEGAFDGPNPVVIMSEPSPSRDSEAAMRSARIGSGRASFDDMMADRDKAIEDGKDLVEYLTQGRFTSEDMDRRKKD